MSGNVNLFIEKTERDVVELKRKIKKLNGQILTFTYLGGFKTYRFKALNDSQGYIELIPSGTGYDYLEVKVNNILLYKGSVNKVINLYVGYYLGAVELTVNSNENAYPLIVKAYGNLSYNDEQFGVYHSTLSSGEYVTVFNGNSVTFYTETDGVLTEKLTISGVIQGVVTYSTTTGVYIAFITDTNFLNFGYYSAVTKMFHYAIKNGYKASSVCGYYYNDYHYLYATRLNSVYALKYKINGAVSFVKTNVIGSRGYSDAEVANAFITVDGLNVARLIEKINGKYQSTNIESGSNYHIYKQDGGYEITYFDGVSYRKFLVINGKPTKSEIVAYCHEKIKYNTVSVFRRNGELITVKE